jgi:hypothetical protein
LGVVESHGENFNTEWAPLLFFFNKLGPARLLEKGEEKGWEKNTHTKISWVRSR